MSAGNLDAADKAISVLVSSIDGNPLLLNQIATYPVGMLAALGCDVAVDLFDGTGSTESLSELLMRKSFEERLACLNIFCFAIELRNADRGFDPFGDVKSGKIGIA